MPTRPLDPAVSASRPAAIPDDPRSDVAFCRAMIRTGSRSFFLASHLLPANFRGAVYALYAFCRQADDEIDGGGDPFIGLEKFRKRLDSIYGDGLCSNPFDRALSLVVRDYGLPRELLEALLEGFAWDAQGRQYRSLAGVYGYSVRVAGSVGIMMALLMEVRDEQLLARAADLGVAMQLSNIARDVGEDARNGRVYLPMRWLREAGLSSQELIRDPQPSQALASVVGRLLSAAECLYTRADSGIAELPKRFRPGIYAARRLYAGIGHELLRRGCDSVSNRTVVPPHRKLGLLARTLVMPRVDSVHLNAEPLPQVRFLIRAVNALPKQDSVVPAETGLGADIEWALGIIGELERRDRHAYSSGSVK